MAAFLFNLKSVTQVPHNLPVIRKNDRNFQVGDVLILKEWDNIKYSGREIGAVVRYVLRDFIGLQEGYVALGLQILS